VNAGSGKCIDLNEPTPVQWRCLNTPFEEWRFVEVVDGFFFQIVSHQTGECMAAEGDENGTPVIMEPCAPLDHTVPVSQLWIVGPAGTTFQVGRAGQYVCLDLENGDPSDGVPMQIWGCNPNTNNQRWRQL
jgi:Ricin-type beta-trefoil lectin domain